MTASKLVLALLAVLIGSITGQSTLPVAFAPIRDQLQSIDDFIREQDKLDRANTDEAIGVLARKLNEIEKDANAFTNECDVAHVEEEYLSNKAVMSSVLIGELCGFVYLCNCSFLFVYLCYFWAQSCNASDNPDTNDETNA
jgi:hypothetical protein